MRGSPLETRKVMVPGDKVRVVYADGRRGFTSSVRRVKRDYVEIACGTRFHAKTLTWNKGCASLVAVEKEVKSG
jgi:hypothetical protein